MKYRTKEQFEEIVESCINGNWTQAGQEGSDYGFYALDLIKAQEEAKENGGFCFEDEKDIAVLVEMIDTARSKEE